MAIRFEDDNDKKPPATGAKASERAPVGDRPPAAESQATPAPELPFAKPVKAEKKRKGR